MPVDTLGDSYGAMLDWSDHDRLTFSGQSGSGGMDLFRVRYRIAATGSATPALAISRSAWVKP